MHQVTDDAPVRVFHPEVLKELPLDVALELKQVGDDLRSGVIKPELFDMADFNEWTPCGTAHCIAGWVAYRMRRAWQNLFYSYDENCQATGAALDRVVDGRIIIPPLGQLFYGGHPSDPHKAADAIENYLYNYAANPWGGRLIQPRS